MGKNTPINESRADEPMRGAAKYSRHEGRFRPNDDGVTRSLDEALAVAERYGVCFDVTEYRVILDPRTRHDCDASYFDLEGVAPGSFVPWSRITAGDGRIVIRLQSRILASDAWIVAVLAHERYETEHLKEEFARNGGRLPAERLRRLVESSGESLHNAAWDYADALVDQHFAKASSP